MFEKEAIWIAGELTLELSPVLNVGSSTRQFRMVGQPWIHKRIVAPFEARGGRFLHLDMKEAEGVDLVGDLADPTFQEKVKALEIKAVLCSNLLEHVADPQAVCRLLTEIVRPGGIVILTVPYRYPYHDDPIDTMFRPTAERLAHMMTGCELVNAEVVTIEGTSFARQLLTRPRLLATTTLRLLMPFYRWNAWKQTIGYLPQAFKPFQVTCATFRRVP
jgi:SAM-dependent methyltransferase